MTAGGGGLAIPDQPPDLPDNPPDLSTRIAQVRAEIAALTGDTDRPASGPPGADLVPQRSTDPVVAKQQMGGLRSQATRRLTRIADLAEELRELQHEEMALALAARAELQRVIDQIDNAIFTVNLYLGRDEQIVLLRDGPSAPAATPIALRQLLLFMDEECAVAAEHGGLSPIDIDTFDEWLLADPLHLDQVLPETKGIAALRPRRDLGRHRHSPHAKELAEANRCTYWLVRNGERVYRILTQLTIDSDRVLPLADEFERIFTHRDHRTGDRVPLRPGSHDWERAQDKAQERERTFMRIGLVLEGLLHRTPIFHPLPDRGVSFLDPRDVREGRVRYITDAEATLGTGSESFDEWRRRLMNEMRVGMRVILAPGLSEQGDRRDGNPRLSPRRATLPDVETLYVIDSGTAKTGLVFRYHEDERWVNSGQWGGEHRRPKRRASCTVYPSDRFVLPFDLADPADMRRFLRTRSDRHHYVDLFPVITAALAAKEREAAVEAPFQTMLAGVLARDNNVTVADAQDAVADLVVWWKTKNRWHRPLLLQAMHPDTSDVDVAGAAAEQAERSALAVRMIVAEHARRLGDARRPINHALVDELRRLHPDRLTIARPRHRGYLVVTPAQDGKNVYTHEHEYSSRGDLRETRHWVLPRLATVGTWVTLETTDRWAAWDFTASDRDHLRGPDEDRMLAQCRHEFDTDPQSLALAWDGRTFTWWTAAGDATIDEEHLITTPPEGPRYLTRTRTWTSGPDGAQLDAWRSDWRGSTALSVHVRELPWDTLTFRGLWDDAPRRNEYNVVERSAGAVARFETQAHRFRTAAASADRLAQRATDLVASVEAEWLRRAWAAERRRFDDDFGDPDLWEAHRKSKEPHIHMPPGWNLGQRNRPSTWDPPNLLWDAVSWLVQAGEDPDGMTVAEVLSEANQRFPAGLRAIRRRPSDPPVSFAAPDELGDYILSAPPCDDDNDLDA